MTCGPNGMEPTGRALSLQDAANESCKPGDPAFRRTRFEIVGHPRASLDAAIAAAAAAGYEIIDLGCLEVEARLVAADHARLAKQSHGVPSTLGSRRIDRS